jgi:hypothetical protein
MSKLQKILSGFVVLQLALVVVVFWPRGTAVSDAGPLFTNLDIANIQRIAIAGENDEIIEFVRDGDSWVLPEAGNYPANETSLAEMITNMSAVQTNRLISRTPDSHARLQVADNDFLRRVTLTRNDGTAETFFVGSSATGQDTHVRRGGEDETYLTNAVQSWQISSGIASWIDTTYVSLTQADINRVVVENNNGRLEFARVSDTDWELADLAEGEVFDQTAFTTMLNQIVNLRMSRPLGTAAEASYGLDTPQATVTLFTDADTFTLLVGATDEEASTTTVKWSGSDYYAAVSSFSVENIATYTTADFIQEPTPELEIPIPTPEG